MDLATLRVVLEGDASSLDKTLATSQAKLQAFAANADKSTKVKIGADTSELDSATKRATGQIKTFNKAASSQGKVKFAGDMTQLTRDIQTADNRIKSFYQANSRKQVIFQGDARGVQIAARSAEQALKSVPRNTTAVITVDEHGATETRTALQLTKQEADQLNGQRATVTVDEQGATATATALRGVSTESDRTRVSFGTLSSSSNQTRTSLGGVGTDATRAGAGMRQFGTDSSSAGAQSNTVAGNIRNLATNIRALQTVLLFAAIPTFIAGIASIVPVAAASASGILALAAAIGTGLVGAAMAGGSAIGLLAGAMAVLKAPLSFLGSGFKEYEKSLQASSGSTSQAASQANAYENALDSLASAQQGVADAQVAAQEKVDNAIQAYNDSLEAVTQAEQAAEDARVQAAESVDTATRAYADSVRAVEDAERAAQDARLKYSDATKDLTMAQEELNRAIRDEPLNQAEADLSAREAALGLEEAQNRVAEAQKRVNEAKPEDQTSAQLAYESALLGTERAQLRLSRAQNEYYDTSTSGSDQLLSAQEGVDSAYRAQEDALQGVYDADRDLLDARDESSRAYLEIGKAEAQGARQIEDADRAVLKAREDSSRKYDEIGKAQAEGQRDIEKALMAVDKAERQVAQAAAAMGEGQGKAAGDTSNLSAAMIQLYDRIIAFKEEARVAFQPATDSLALLGVKALDVASSYLPAVAESAYKTAEGLHTAFDTINQLLNQQAPQTAIQQILDAIPQAAQMGATAFGALGVAAVTAFSRTVPYGLNLLSIFQSLALELNAWVQSAQGIATIDSFLATAWDTATRLGGVVWDLGAAFVNLMSSIGAAGLPEQMLSGLERMAQFFRDVTTEGTTARAKLDEFNQAAGPILTALGGLAATVGIELADMAYNLATATVSVDESSSAFTDLAGGLGLLGESGQEVALIPGMLDALAAALPSAAAALEALAVAMGPEIIQLLENLPTVFDAIARNSGLIVSPLSAVNLVLETFNSMSPGMQDAVIQLFALQQTLRLFGAGSIIGGLFGAGAAVAELGFKMKLLNVLTGGKFPTLPGLLKNLARSALGLAPALAGLAGLSAIAIDIIVHWPDIKAGFSQAYTDAREGGDGVGVAFIEGLGAAVQATTIGSMISTVVNGAMDIVDQARGSGPSLVDVILGDASLSEFEGGGTILGSIVGTIDSVINGAFDYIDSVRGTGPSLLDVVMGNATLEDVASSDTVAGNIISAVQSAWTAASEFIGGLAPEITLMDVIMGGATMEEAAAGGNIAANIILALQGAWTAVTEWLASLVPPLSLMDVIMGGATLEEAASGGNIAAQIILALQGAWAAVTEFLASLVPEMSLMDIIMGVSALTDAGAAVLEPILTVLQSLWDQVVAAWDGIKAAVAEAMASIWSDISSAWGEIVSTVSDAASQIWEAVSSAWSEITSTIGGALSSIWETISTTWNSITTTISEAMTLIWQDIITGNWTGIWTTITTTMTSIWTDLTTAWESIKTTILDAMTYIWNDVIVVTWESIKLTISEAMLYIWESIIVYYWDSISTTILETLTYIWNDIIIVTWEGIKQTLYDAMYYIWNDIIIFVWDSVSTYLLDTMNYIWNDIIVATWEEIKTAVYDAMYWIWNDVIVYYWEQITTATTEFAEGFKNAVIDGFEAGVNGAIDVLQKLLDAIDEVLTAINVSPLGITLEHVEIGGSSAAEEGLAMGAKMARGGQRGQGKRGGAGTTAANPQTVIWNEQDGMEFWITEHGPAAFNTRLLGGAADMMGYDLLPKPGTTHRATTQRRTGPLPGNTRTKGHRRMEDGGVQYAAIGFGSDVGEGGLGSRALEVASDVRDKFGVYVNTYTGPADDLGSEHGSLHGNVSSNTFDFWGPGGVGDQLDFGTGDAIWAYLKENYGSELDTIIWQYAGENAGGGFADDDHGDHLHASIGGGGLGSTAGAVAGRVFQMAQGIWTAAMEALNLDGMDLGAGAFWDGIETYMRQIDDWAWEWLQTKIPRGTGSALAQGALMGLGPSGDIMELLNAGIKWSGWDEEDLAALIEIWGNRESGFDPNAINPMSGAYGIPQIDPGSHGHPVPLGDAAAQIEWGMNYIAERYGSPKEALKEWDATGQYKMGGRVPGDPGGAVPAMLHAGELVIPHGLAPAMLNFMETVSDVFGGRGGSPNVEIRDPEIPLPEEFNRGGPGRGLSRAGDVVSNPDVVARLDRLERTLSEAFREPFDVSDDAAKKIGKNAGGRPGGDGSLAATKERIDRENLFAGRRS